MPSIKCCIKNAAQSTFKVVKNKLIRQQSILISIDIRNKRFSVCQSCDLFNHDNGRCNECGCFMKVKSLLSAMECPLDKWK